MTKSDAIQTCFILVLFCITDLCIAGPTLTPQWQVNSPDLQLRYTLRNHSDDGLSFRVDRVTNKQTEKIIGWSKLGIDYSWIEASDLEKTLTADFSKSLRFKEKKYTTVNDEYEMLSGKRKLNRYRAEEGRFTFIEKEFNREIRVDVQVANDGIAFRYVLLGNDSLAYKLGNESTEFNLGRKGTHWGQPYDFASFWTPSYETPYNNGVPIGTRTKPKEGVGWGFPSLFQQNQNTWLLLHETNLQRNYHGSHLNADASNGVYKIAPPLAKSANGFSSNIAAAQLPAHLPWRFLLVTTSPGQILESNRVFDLAEPSKLNDTDWIKPGISSWSWWSDHDSSRNIESLKGFIDLASEMSWPYSLVDANWNLISESVVRELTEYASERKVALSFWYNSGGKDNYVTEQPRNIMNNARKRRDEFAKLRKIGVKAVKIDFFNSDKQDMIERYIDILEDAADHKIMVVFHGSTIPRGWERTYPNLMSMESVRGAEAYTFPSSPNYAELASYQNSVIPFTRNVIGSMDYTPISLSDQHTPRISSNAHEAALGVIFESGIQHLSDSIESYRSTPESVKRYLSSLPAAWDNTKYLSGYPGQSVVLARKHSNRWYIAGINSLKKNKEISLDLSFIDKPVNAILIYDDQDNPRIFKSKAITLQPGKRLELTMMPVGGFVIFPVD